jgi:hypothetical protein
MIDDAIDCRNLPEESADIKAGIDVIIDIN